MGACGRVWGNVAGVVAGCGACGRVDVCGRGSAYSIDGDMWKGVGACGRVCHISPSMT